MEILQEEITISVFFLIDDRFSSRVGCNMAADFVQMFCPLQVHQISLNGLKESIAAQIQYTSVLSSAL